MDQAYDGEAANRRASGVLHGAALGRFVIRLRARYPNWRTVRGAQEIAQEITQEMMIAQEMELAKRRRSR